MFRHPTRPREGWQETVTEQGLIYPTTPKPDGTTVNYWNESAWYEFFMPEVEAIEAATEELWAMSIHAVGWMLDNYDDARLGLPEGALRLARESIDREDPSVYGRFDLCVDRNVESIKMLELNGDTPTGLIETGVAQWYWLQDFLPDNDQFNSVHERLVERWRTLAARRDFPRTVHFLWDDVDTSGEEEMTVHYMRDCAIQGIKAAGADIATYGQPIKRVIYDEEDRAFYDHFGNPIECAYKLYPWESLLRDEFGPMLLDAKRFQAKPTLWIEPAWKLLLSTKALLPALWELYPDHPLLLPSYFDKPHDLTEWIAKPLQGREGDNIKIHTDLEDISTADGGYGAEGYVYQQWNQLPDLDGNYAMIGSWIIDGQAAGMIVRESDGYVTDYFSRVVPHVISDGLKPDEATVQQWRNERVSEPKPIAF